MKGLVTVVVPVYHVEQYLDRCVESIVNQTYRNLQILLIDDGSPDRCPEICDEWAKRDKRIKVIHKKNQGLGMARNTGIEHAEGEYICFFDSDDFVDADLIQSAYGLALQEQAEIVLFGMKRVSRKQNVIEEIIPSTPKTVYTNKEVQQTLLPGLLTKRQPNGEMYHLPLSACTMLVSVELVRKIKWRFVSEREFISEDTYSLLKLYKDVKRVAVLRKALYHYYVNSQSLTQTFHADRYERTKDFYQKCVALCHECEYSDRVIYSCSGQFMGNTISFLKQAVLRKDGRAIIRKTLNDKVLQKVVLGIQECSFKVRVLLWSIKNKHDLMCWLLLKMQNSVNRSRE